MSVVFLLAYYCFCTFQVDGQFGTGDSSSEISDDDDDDDDDKDEEDDKKSIDGEEDEDEAEGPEEVSGKIALPFVCIKRYIYRCMILHTNSNERISMRKNVGNVHSLLAPWQGELFSSWITSVY